MRTRAILFVVMLLAACGQPASNAPPPAPAEDSDTSASSDQSGDLPPVEADNLAAPDSGFAPVEPSELGVQGAPSIREALAPLVSSDTNEGTQLQLSIVQNGDDAAVADIVRSGGDDDAVSAAHLRVEFRKEADGWYPTNAYRRTMCTRGVAAGQWSATPCP